MHRSRFLDPPRRRLPTYDEPAPDWFDRVGAFCCALVILGCIIIPILAVWIRFR